MRAEQLRILHLEDDINDALLIKRILNKGFENAQITLAQNKRSYEANLGQKWDVIISDYHVPEMSGYEALEMARAIDEEVPFIIVSGAVDDETAAKAISLGARDYVMKDNLTRLIPAVKRELATKRQQDKQRQSKERHTALINTVEILNSSLRTSDKLDMILENLLQISGYDASTIYLVNTPYNAMIKSKGFSQRIEDKFGAIISASVQLGDLFSTSREDYFKSKYFIFSRRGFYTGDLRKIRFGRKDELISDSLGLLINEGYRSLVLLPVNVHRILRGCILIAGRQSLKFSEEIVIFFEQLSNMLSIYYAQEEIEKELLKREERIASVLEHSVSIFTIMDDKLNMKMASNQIQGLLGYSPSEFKENWRRYLTDNEINESAIENIQYTIDSCMYQGSFEMEFRHKNGKKVILDVRQMPIIKNGITHELVGVSNDVTLQKTAEKELRFQERKYRNLVEKARTGIAILDDKGTIIFANGTFSDFLDNRQEDITGTDIFWYIHSEDRDKLQNYVERIKEGNKESSLEMRGRQKGGKTSYFEINMDRLEDQQGNYKGMRIYLWNITLRKTQEIILLTMYNIAKSIRLTNTVQELFGSIRGHLSRILDTTNLYIALYDEETDLLRIPLGVDSKDALEEFPAGKTITKYMIQKQKAMLLRESDMDDLTGKGIIDLVGAPCKIWLGAPLEDEEEIFGAIVVQSYEDESLYTDQDLQVLEFVSHEIASALRRKHMELELKRALNNLQQMHNDLEKKVKDNVKELRRKDAQLLQKRSQAAMGALISRLAHNWRQPLNNISVVLQTIREAWKFDELDYEYLEVKINICCKQLEELSRNIDRFRQYYKSSEKEQDFDTVEVLREVINLNKSRFADKDIVMKVELQGKSVIKGYRSEFSEVIHNIISNAFTVLTERKVASGQLIIKQYFLDGYNCISFRDNGGGVNAEIRDIIFELYISTKNEKNNTGIGLYLSRVIVEEHLRGKISLMNHEDGAEFLIKLPL